MTDGPESSLPGVVIGADKEAVAATMAADIAALLVDVQSAGRTPHVVLTGGSVARLVHRSLSEHGEVEWARVEFWWGDERYVEAQDEERNVGQARADLLDRVKADPGLIHQVGAADETDSLEEAASSYAERLETALGEEGRFDVVMLGIGPDGHCASLFPGRPEVHAEGLAIAVTHSPKPPPGRVSMTMELLRRAEQVWFVATGEEKAQAVSRSVAGGPLDETPAAGPRGVRGTRWYVDEAAAADLQA